MVQCAFGVPDAEENRRGYTIRRGGATGPVARTPLPLVLFALLAGAAGPAAAAGPAPPDTAESLRPYRWIFAAEDTARIPAFFEMSEIEIRADRLKIGDIVQQCIDREEELRARIETHEYTRLSTAVLSYGGAGADADRQRVIEHADHVFFRKPDEQRTVPVRRATYALERGERKEWAPDPDDDPAIDVEYGDLADLPFYLENKNDYDFEILSREIVGDRVIYEVHLKPRSDFEIAPSGTIWIDTSTFSILREEFDFGSRVPMPMLIRRIGPYVRERERIGDLWVWKRMVIRVELRAKLLRWIDRDVPDAAEWVVVFGDHRVNQGWSTDPDEGGGRR
jgi:hypothetical protein